MKILMNTQDYLVGGIPHVVKNMIQNRHSLFQNAEFITINLEKEVLRNQPLRVSHKKGYRAIEGYYDRSVFTKRLASYSRLDQIGDDFSELSNICRDILSQENPNLLILNGTGIIPWALMKASEALSIPTILYYHGSITIEENASIIKGKAPILYEFEKSFLKLEYGYIFPSDLLRNTICKNFQLQNQFLYHDVIPNSVPLYFFQPPKPAVSFYKKPVRVGFIMRWCTVKNKIFVMNFVKFIEAHSMNYQVYLITDKEEVVLHEMQESKYFIIQKQLQQKDLHNFLRDSLDIVLCPSVFETYGNIAQESLASGTPVLIHKNMGIRETFEKIGLGHWVIDFEKESLFSIEKSIRGALASQIPSQSHGLLKNHSSSQTINQKRYSFFLNYIEWFYEQSK